ncbi:MraZ N-terminal domain containing protein, partial [candidate division WWE3 bacterium]|nr:MraZ N-terminal domain containing protein [candidate division WWE3 bacterium]
MKMLLGEYSPNLTDGSRLALPKKLREQIDEDTVILTKGFEPCIFLYAYSDWLNETAKHMENS